MKITVPRIPHEGLNVSFTLEREWLERCFGEFGDELVCVTPVETMCRISRMGTTVMIHGSLSTRIKVPCARCLEPADLTIKADFRYVLVPKPAGFKDDVALTADDIEYGYYTDECIDLLPILYEQVCLQLPMVVLCREECKGICPHCGQNLNLGSCYCEDRIRDERWSILKSIVVVPK